MSELLLNDEYLALVEAGQKTSTVRRGWRVFEIGEHLSLKSSEGEQTVDTVITDVQYTHFGTLAEEDATRDGFESVEELRNVLQSIYGELPAEQEVTIIVFRHRSA